MHLRLLIIFIFHLQPFQNLLHIQESEVRIFQIQVQAPYTELFITLTFPILILPYMNMTMQEEVVSTLLHRFPDLLSHGSVPFASPLIVCGVVGQEEPVSSILDFHAEIVYPVEEPSQILPLVGLLIVIPHYEQYFLNLSLQGSPLHQLSLVPLYLPCEVPKVNQEVYLLLKNEWIQIIPYYLLEILRAVLPQHIVEEVGIGYEIDPLRLPVALQTDYPFHGIISPAGHLQILTPGIEEDGEFPVRTQAPYRPYPKFSECTDRLRG